MSGNAPVAGVLEAIDATGVVAILRGDYGASVTAVVDALAAGGVRAIVARARAFVGAMRSMGD